MSLWQLLAGISNYSNSQVFFDVCRAFQGIGVAATIPSALAILGTVYKPGPRKNLTFALFAVGAPGGAVFGGIFAALLAQHVNWPWAFYIGAITCALFGTLSFVIIPSLTLESKNSSKELEDQPTFDWLGAIIGPAGLILFNFAWNRAPSTGWASAQCIATLIIGLLLIIIFFIVERHVKDPLIPVKHISNDAAWILLIEGLGWSSFGILFFYALNLAMTLRHDSMVDAAVQLLPAPFSGLIASGATAILLTRGIADPPTILTISMVAFCVANIICATMPVHQKYWVQLFWAYVISPFGMDMAFPAGTILLSNLMPPERQGIAASMIATMVYYSQSIGLGIAGTVQTHVQGDDVLKGYRGAWYLGIGLSGLGVVVAGSYALSSRIRDRSIGDGKDLAVEDQEEQDTQVDAGEKEYTPS